MYFVFFSRNSASDSSSSGDGSGDSGSDDTTGDSSSGSDDSSSDSDSGDGWVDRLIEGITAPFEAFKSSVDNLFSPLENTVKGITAIMTFLNNLKNFLGEVFSELFVPDPEFIEERFSQFLTNIPFIDNFLEVAGFITDQILILDGGVVPKLNFTLSKTQGQYTFEDCEVSIDFSWYAPYKEYMDKILAAVIWFGFLRRMYFKLPDIINGAGAVTDVIEDSRNFEPREKRRKRKGG